MKTGFRPDPTVVHPSIGAILCHELPQAGTDIPRHVSILPGQWPGRGGFLGDGYDAFRMEDPANPVPDTRSHLPKQRDEGVVLMNILQVQELSSQVIVIMQRRQIVSDRCDQIIIHRDWDVIPEESRFQRTRVIADSGIKNIGSN